jgi:hypothetical protein
MIENGKYLDWNYSVENNSFNLKLGFNVSELWFTVPAVEELHIPVYMYMHTYTCAQAHMFAPSTKIMLVVSESDILYFVSWKQILLCKYVCLFIYSTILPALLVADFKCTRWFKYDRDRL